MPERLSRYRAMRDFEATPEPRGRLKRSKTGNLYVIQKHAATRLHYDFRLELDGVLLSWAVTRGPSLNPADRRLAVRTEDHPIEYGGFEGVIPAGYGAGTVMLWDTGAWAPQGDPHKGLKEGNFKFVLMGERLQGGFALIRMKPRPRETSKRDSWLLIKERDQWADDRVVATEKWSDSVKTDRDLRQIQDQGETYRPGKAYPAVSRTKAAKPRSATVRKGPAPRSPSRKKRTARKKAAGRSSRKKSEAEPGFAPARLAILRNSSLPSGGRWLVARDQV